MALWWERGYVLMHLTEEKADLDEKLSELFNFCKSPPFHELDGTDRELLETQYGFMKQYALILSQRIERSTASKITP